MIACRYHMRHTPQSSRVYGISRVLLAIDMFSSFTLLVHLVGNAGENRGGSGSSSGGEGIVLWGINYSFLLFR